MRLITEDGRFVARVHPMLPLPLPPSPVVFWGERVFLRAADADDTWREVNMPTVVVEEP